MNKLIAWFWRTEKRTVASILSSFHTLVSTLENHAADQLERAAAKQADRARLASEIDTHAVEAEQATAAAQAIGALITVKASV